MAAPIVAAGIAAASAAGNIYAQGKMNKKTREWNEKMYGRQREDALADWNAQNFYNSPAEQMKRLKEAKLNPNLVYENGATSTASSVRSSDSGSWNPQTPDISSVANQAIQGFEAYQDYTLRDEQVKNMVAMRRNMELDAALKVLTASGKEIGIAQDKLDYEKASQLKDTSIQQVEELVRSLKTSTDIKISQESRDAAMHAPNLTAAFEKVLLLENENRSQPLKRELLSAQIDSLRKSGQLQQLEINMRKLGLSFNDSAILRVLSQFANGRTLPEVVKDLWNLINDSGGGVGESVIDHGMQKVGMKGFEVPDSVKNKWKQFRK